MHAYDDNTGVISITITHIFFFTVMYINYIISLFLFTKTKSMLVQSVSCQFDSPYICGYDITYDYNEDGAWIWRHDNGFLLQDNTRSKGILRAKLWY